MDEQKIMGGVMDMAKIRARHATSIMKALNLVADINEKRAKLGIPALMFGEDAKKVIVEKSDRDARIVAKKEAKKELRKEYLKNIREATNGNNGKS